MSPFEALYGKSCRSPVCWDEVGERKLLGPELRHTMNEAIQKIRACMQIVQSRHKSYSDVSRKDLKFETGDKVFLKVATVKGVLRFGRKGKLSPQFIGHFEVLERIWPYSLSIGVATISIFDSQCFPCFVVEEVCDGFIPCGGL
ncbi:uncharacterized protein LOC120067516 [Benincasa hispida]|uniref:uncharacterized protein LOC120067516 n=1 Tax=Benincasa hispida TaxID=102211 RepID=UPI0018FFD458|nr:uncharacterized protein LOC120067516 [Benincasa hispida]